MKVYIIGPTTRVPRMPWEVLPYERHHDCNGIIVTSPNAAAMIDDVRIPVLAIGPGLLSCAGPRTSAPPGPQTVILRTGSKPQEWFDGAETIERTLVAAIDGKHAAKHRLPISGITVAQHGAIYDLEERFFVGIGWYPEADDPIWLAFRSALSFSRVSVC